MNPIKSLREKQGLTQQMLSDKSGLSLRTIQRLEKENKAPKGHSLQALAENFELSTAEFKGFFIIPLSNILIPLFIWRKNKSISEVDEAGRKILNYQIIWTLCLFLSLSLAPFINLGLSISTPLILIVLFLGIVINLFFIFKTALYIQKEDYDFLNLPLRLI